MFFFGRVGERSGAVLESWVLPPGRVIYPEQDTSSDNTGSYAPRRIPVARWLASTTGIGMGVKQCEPVCGRRGLSSNVVALSGGLDRVGVGVMPVRKVQKGERERRTESYDIPGGGGEIIDLRCGARRCGVNRTGWSGE